MKLRFSWINARKSLIFSSLIDFALISYLFFNTFKNYISYKPLLLFLSGINPFVWIISSYIIGRYVNTQGEKFIIIIRHFFKTLFIVFFNIFFSQFLFKIFWNWNYMNFESFSNFLNYFSIFYIKIFIFSSLFQTLINLYLSKKYSNKLIWLFLGDENRKKYFKKLIGLKSKYKIEIFDQKFFNKNQIQAQGVIIDDEKILKNKNIQFLFDINHRGMKFMKISNWCERYLNRYPTELIKLSDIVDGKFSYDQKSFKSRIKRIFESILSLIILMFTFPILLLSALLIKLEDGGPIFYSQIRNGFEGKQFRIIKLRTMITNAEKDGIQWANKADIRITKIGNLLRKLRIDELPQLLLVISGEMSLIGPRPERPIIDILLRKHIPYYDLRYSVKPGISGWAQVNYPYGASIEDSKYKLSYDFYYIKNFSILLDCMIFFKTLRLVFNGKGSIPKS
tara:strand:- start:16353 stop:17705 length:1353 start_codon:yes stop_codon:yes gene_type:complete